MNGLDKLNDIINMGKVLTVKSRHCFSSSCVVVTYVPWKLEDLKLGPQQSPRNRVMMVHANNPSFGVVETEGHLELTHQLV